MITIEGDKIIVSEGGNHQEYDIGSAEGFGVLSRLWLRSGWDNKHVYSFTWLGRPIIQLPEDLIRIQEVIYQLQPDLIIETGVAHGGSLMFYASLCKLIGKGRVIGIDIDIRDVNKAAIKAHPLAPFITLVDGNSIDPRTIQQVRAMVKPNETVIVLLDSCHEKEHVLAELQAY